MAEGVMIVTGGSRGIGAEVASQAAKEGFDVFIGFNSKAKRALRVQDRIAEESPDVVASIKAADLSNVEDCIDFLQAADEFAERRNKKLSALVLNAAGGLEPGSTPFDAVTINSSSPISMARLFLLRHSSSGTVSYITSHPSHFWNVDGNEMPMDGYEVVASSKNAGESKLRAMFELAPTAGRLLVASADLVSETSGAMLIQKQYAKLKSGRDIFEDRDAQLNELVGRGTPSATEFAKHIVGQITSDAPSGHTLYLPQYILGSGDCRRIAGPADLPFGIGSNSNMYTFVN